MNVVNRKPSGPGSLHCYVPRVCAVRAPCLAPVARSDDQLALSSYRTRSVSCRRPLVAGATVTEYAIKLQHSRRDLLAGNCVGGTAPCMTTVL